MGPKSIGRLKAYRGWTVAGFYPYSIAAHHHGESELPALVILEAEWYSPRLWMTPLTDPAYSEKTVRDKVIEAQHGAALAKWPGTRLEQVLGKR